MKSRIIPIKQKHSSGCGPTSIQMVAQSLGAKLSRNSIEKACNNWKEEGMSNEELVTAFDILGFKTKALYNASWDQLKEASLESAIVVSWMLKGYIGHFSVVDKVTDDAVWLVDPESGKVVKMAKIVFFRLWLDYGENWYPEKISDFQLRWMVVVTN